MNNVKSLIILALFTFGFTNGAQAQSNKSSQQVNVSVSEIDVISITGNIELGFSHATAGNDLDSVTGSATWSVSTNGKNRKVTAQLESDLPNGMEAKLKLPG